MENRIKDNIDNPDILEQMFRTEKNDFIKSFFSVYPEIADTKMAHFWKARLEYDQPVNSKANIRKHDIFFLIFSCLIAGFLIEIPKIFDFNPDNYSFYQKNIGLIVFVGLSLYLFLSKNQLNIKNILISTLIFAVSAIYINLLPSVEDSHSINLTYIHLPLFLWCLYGFIFIDFDKKNKIRRMDFIKYNGDLAILTAIILIGGGILTAITIGLFLAIDFDVEGFFSNYIVLIGIISTPIIATYIVKNFPTITSKIAPVIANIFSPLILITLIIYLASIIATGKNPYNDRDFLLVFNLLLLVVMAIIVFSVSETSVNKKQKFNEFILFLLTIVTLILNAIALSAILIRLVDSLGFTPNRTAVLGSNILVFGNLVLIMIDLYRVIFKGKNIKIVEQTVAKYLPLYMIWTFFVTFVLPFIFGLK